MRLEGALTAADMFSTKIQQNVATAEYDDSFTSISYTQFNTGPATSKDTNIVIGREQDISQTFRLDTSNRIQKIEDRRRSGYRGTTAGAFVDGINFFKEAITTGGTVTLNSTPINWVEGDAIRSNIITQSALDPNAAPIAMHTQTFSNETTLATAQDTLFDIGTPANPFDWAADLGPAPTFP
jgi:hypothetical protein